MADQRVSISDSQAGSGLSGSIEVNVSDQHVGLTDGEQIKQAPSLESPVAKEGIEFDGYGGRKHRPPTTKSFLGENPSCEADHCASLTPVVLTEDSFLKNRPDCSERRKSNGYGRTGKHENGDIDNFFIVTTRYLPEILLPGCADPSLLFTNQKYFYEAGKQNEEIVDDEWLQFFALSEIDDDRSLPEDDCQPAEGPAEVSCASHATTVGGVRGSDTSEKSSTSMHEVLEENSVGELPNKNLTFRSIFLEPMSKLACICPEFLGDSRCIGSRCYRLSHASSKDRSPRKSRIRQSVLAFFFMFRSCDGTKWIERYNVHPFLEKDVSCHCSEASQHFRATKENFPHLYPRITQSGNDATTDSSRLRDNVFQSEILCCACGKKTLRRLFCLKLAEIRPWIADHHDVKDVENSTGWRKLVGERCDDLWTTNPWRKIVATGLFSQNELQCRWLQCSGLSNNPINLTLSSKIQARFIPRSIMNARAVPRVSFFHGTGVFRDCARTVRDQNLCDRQVEEKKECSRHSSPRGIYRDSLVCRVTEAFATSLKKGRSFLDLALDQIQSTINAKNVAKNSIAKNPNTHEEDCGNDGSRRRYSIHKQGFPWTSFTPPSTVPSPERCWRNVIERHWKGKVAVRQLLAEVAGLRCDYFIPILSYALETVAPLTKRGVFRQPGSLQSSPLVQLRSLWQNLEREGQLQEVFRNVHDNLPQNCNETKSDLAKLKFPDGGTSSAEPLKTVTKEVEEKSSIHKEGLMSETLIEQELAPEPRVASNSCLINSQKWLGDLGIAKGSSKRKATYVNRIENDESLVTWIHALFSVVAPIAHPSKKIKHIDLCD